MLTISEDEIRKRAPALLKKKLKIHLEEHIKMINKIITGINIELERSSVLGIKSITNQ